MQYSIVACFQSIKLIDEAIGKLNNALAIKSLLSPHVTLVTFGSEVPATVLATFMDIVPFKTTANFGGIGTFESEKNNTIFLNVKKTAEWLRLYHQYSHEFSGCDVDNFSLEKEYHPHVTLATHLTKEQITIAKAIIGEILIDPYVPIKSIALIDESYKTVGWMPIK